MNKRKFYLMSFIMTIILCISISNVNAQVTIGSNDAPHPGAALELKSSKGLLLSKANLANADIFQLSGDQKVAEGMMVYNTNENIINGNGTGIYVWDGAKWQITGKAPINLVTEVKVYTFPPVTSISPNSAPLQLSALVLPAEATNKNLIWSVVSGSASISADGLLTVNADATKDIVVKASATDGSGKSDEYHLTNVLPSTGTTTVPGNNNNSYRVYCFDPSLKLGCWMIDNSKEGTPDATKFEGSPQGQTAKPTEGYRGYYYTWANANDANGTAACPAGYSLPDNTLWERLKTYIDSPAASTEEKSYWHDATFLAGEYHPTDGWQWWNQKGYWWSADSYATNNIFGEYYSASYTAFSSDHALKSSSSWMSVRCVKSNY